MIRTVALTGPAVSPKLCACLRGVLMISAILFATCAWPHATQLSSVRLVLQGRVVEAVIEMDARDLDAALRTQLADSSGGVSIDAVRTGTAAIQALVAARTSLAFEGGGSCQPAPGAVSPKGGHVVLAMRWTCPPGGGALVYSVSLFHDIDPAAKQLVSLSGDAKRIALLSAGTPRVVLADVAGNAGQVAWHYLVTGIEHIAFGWDHMAFVVAVILWGRHPWPLVRVVTAFTLAHSITLALAVLDVVRVPSGPVEVLIALSIVYVAAENFFVRDIGRRWQLTFLFGLVHGFGFAGALREFGLPSDAVGLALAAFNVGVEVGQIAVVLAGLALLTLADRATEGRRDPRLVKGISIVLMVCGIFWTVQRVVG
jgi:hydrogenase/urease accessory protein HupE